MIHTIDDAKTWLEAHGGTWTKLRTAEGWEVIAWVGPFSTRHPVGAATFDAALVEAVDRLVREPLFS